MSGAAAETSEVDGTRFAGNGVDPETERIARANGWKPREEFGGDGSRWVPADVFVARGIEVPAILANRNKALATKIDDLQRQFEETQRTNAEKLDAAVETVTTVTKMLRTSEERAYARARREIQAEMEKAVEAGDTATWKRLDLQREELESTKPLPAPTTRTPPDGTNQPPTPRPNGQLDPAVQKFFAENRWYDPERKREDRDDEMMAYADTVHNGLRTTRPNITLEENLRIVVDETRRRFPTRFGQQQQQANPNPDPDPPEPAAGRADRRNDPASVTPSSGSPPPPRRGANRFTFDAMPQASKDNYNRYAKVLEGKGAALTKEEWAADYWAQFQDDGNP